MQGLGYLYPGLGSEALAVSADGAVIVGKSGLPQEGGGAFVWTAARGMEQLFNILIARGASGLDGWRLDAAFAISPDGRWIAGKGQNPLGQTEAFLAQISPVPTPAAAWLLGSGLAVLRWLKRRVRGRDASA
jgi:uncharacterized membrane protein